jgi:hypothetical protein
MRPHRDFDSINLKRVGQQKARIEIRRVESCFCEGAAEKGESLGAGL